MGLERELPQDEWICRGWIYGQLGECLCVVCGPAGNENHSTCALIGDISPRRGPTSPVPRGLEASSTHLASASKKGQLWCGQRPFLAHLVASLAFLVCGTYYSRFRTPSGWEKKTKISLFLARIMSSALRSCPCSMSYSAPRSIIRYLWCTGL